MDGNIFIDVAALERKPLVFEAVIRPGLLDLSPRCSPTQAVEAVGQADLLDQHGLRSIRVRGHIRATVEQACDRCLQGVSQEFDAEFELYFYPMETLAQGGESAVGRDETEVGFYEGDGIRLQDVVREQLLLWLPMRNLCSPNCKGICPMCGANRNRVACDCHHVFADPRWDPLRLLQLQALIPDGLGG